MHITNRVTMVLKNFLLLLVLPIINGHALPDWLITNITQPTEIIKDGSILCLTNGLISRHFLTVPDFFTLNYYSHERASSLLRAVGPEATISIDGLVYNIGGVLTNASRAYLNTSELMEGVAFDPHAFHVVGYDVKDPEEPYPYHPNQHHGAPVTISWPPKGKRLDVKFRAPFDAPLYHQSISVTMHYEMYDGIPLMSKWFDISAPPSVQDKVEVTVLSVEYLAVNWPWARQGYQWLHIETDWPHSSEVSWYTDPTQHKMPGSFQAVVNCTFSPITSLPIGNGITTFRVLELVVGSSDPERVSLAKGRMLMTLAPQILENPLQFHSVTSNSTKIRGIIDQLSNVGFDMLMYSFGSGMNLESDNITYMKQVSADVAYARNKGIEVGSYDLISWDRMVNVEWMAVESGTMKGACFASGWYDHLLSHITNFMDLTGMTVIVTDGPYPGYPCSSTNHSHHISKSDSIYMQTLLQGDFYKILRKRGVYIAQPDGYFYQGANRRNMGYNENQYSLPRWQDLSISRQGMFDDTFRLPPTAGWMFLPIIDYHGGGSPAQFEPLYKHELEYDWALAQYMTAGVAMVYRGDKIYDSEPVKQMVTKWVKFYKEYRDILQSDIMHVRMADMQGIDCFMHVNPYISRKGLAMVMNPTQQTISTNLTLPLYYTGLGDRAHLIEKGVHHTYYQIRRDYTIIIGIILKPLTYTWFVIQ